MNIAPAAVAAARTDVPTAPTTREEAAKALAGIPVGIATVASFTAMSKSMAGQTASRADLVAQMLEKVSPEQAKMMMFNAIDGAIALAPELAERNESLRQAAAGVEALLTEAAADTTQADPQASLQALMTPLQAILAPVVEAARILDPNFGKDQGGQPPAQG
ncbi:MAG: hypothetical protein KDC46_06985 [Thermoleophilia bacterium]|nr:hypothetical protein [Thermoleophilia bacterium]